MHRGSVLTLAGLTAAAALVTVAGSAATAPVPVKASSRNEVGPAASSECFAWAKSRRAQPNRYDVWVECGGQAPFRVNAPGTTGFSGGIDGNRLVWQQVRGRHSDIRFFDLETRRRISLPPGVNTQDWEMSPTLSGDWLLFTHGTRFIKSIQEIVLMNLVTGERRVLDSARSTRAWLHSGQVNGNFAVWRSCKPFPACDVFRYDIATATKTEMPQNGRTFFGPSVNASGTTYYGRRTRWCGTVEFVKTTLAGATVVLYSFPKGQDFFGSFALTLAAPPPGEIEATRLYIDRFKCKGERWDIYSVEDVERLPPPNP